MNLKPLVFQKNVDAIEQVLAQLVSEKYANVLFELVQPLLQKEMQAYQNTVLPTSMAALTLTLADELGRKVCEKAFLEKKNTQY